MKVSVSAGTSAKPGEYPIFLCGLSNPSTNDYILVGCLAPPLRAKVVEAVTTRCGMATARERRGSATGGRQSRRGRG
jgi:hypothetical protein